MDLIILPNASSVDKGAVCLDGSPPAIYYRPANTSADPTAAYKWVLCKDLGTVPDFATSL